MNQIFQHSCEHVPELRNESVDLTVTSPPYWNAIDYNKYSKDRSADYRPRQKENYQEYLTFLSRAFTEVFRVHKPSTHCAVVIGTVLLNNRHVPVPYHFVNIMEKIGWDFHQDIIWSKVTGGVKRARTTIQRPFPGYYYPNLMLEYILIFRKPGENRIYDRYTKEEKERDRFEIDSVFTQDIANNIWHIAPVSPNQFNHPCPFPEEIPYRLVRLFSYKTDLVFDPFAGIGTTLKVAHALGRQWVGCDLKRDYIETAKTRIPEPLKLRKQLIARFEKISYGDRLPAKNKPQTSNPSSISQLPLVEKDVSE